MKRLLLLTDSDYNLEQNPNKNFCWIEYQNRDSWRKLVQQFTHYDLVDTELIVNGIAFSIDYYEVSGVLIQPECHGSLIKMLAGALILQRINGKIKASEMGLYFCKVPGSSVDIDSMPSIVLW